MAFTTVPANILYPISLATSASTSPPYAMVSLLQATTSARPGTEFPTRPNTHAQFAHVSNAHRHVINISNSTHMLQPVRVDACVWRDVPCAIRMQMCVVYGHASLSVILRVRRVRVCIRTVVVCCCCCVVVLRSVPGLSCAMTDKICKQKTRIGCASHAYVFGRDTRI